jgi:hypothetical protein
MIATKPSPTRAADSGPRSLAELKVAISIPAKFGQYSYRNYVVFRVDFGGESKLIIRFGDSETPHTPIAETAIEECRHLGRPKVVESGSMKFHGDQMVLNTYEHVDHAKTIIEKETGAEVALAYWRPPEPRMMRGN